MKFLITAILATLFGQAALADCTNPAGVAGEVFYNSTHNVTQFCDGTNWYNTGLSVSGAGTSGCTNPAGVEGAMFYNTSFNVVQFCNGDDWVNMSGRNYAAATGTNCTTPTAAEGALIFNNSVNKLQFCNGDNWVNAVHYAPALSISVTDVFATTLYAGDDTTRTITTGIDLENKEGLVWVKNRTSGQSHRLVDTQRVTLNVSSFALQSLTSNGTDALLNYQDGITGFTSTGFSMEDRSGGGTWGSGFNDAGENFVSWTFREAPKFFDIVTYTGNGINRSVPHSLGVMPGMVLIKNITQNHNWVAWHKGASDPNYGILNSTTQFQGYDGFFGATTQHTSSTIFLGFANRNENGTFGGTATGTSSTNNSGDEYVAYLFAHNPDPDGMIQCGSYTGNANTTGPIINLGWRAQWIIYKGTTVTGDWGIHDAERGLTYDGSGFGNRLEPNTTDPETGASAFANFTSTGFQINTAVNDVNGSGENFAYCAIRSPQS